MDQIEKLIYFKFTKMISPISFVEINTIKQNKNEISIFVKILNRKISANMK